MNNLPIDWLSSCWPLHPHPTLIPGSILLAALFFFFFLEKKDIKSCPCSSPPPRYNSHYPGRFSSPPTLSDSFWNLKNAACFLAGTWLLSETQPHSAASQTRGVFLLFFISVYMCVPRGSCVQEIGTFGNIFHHFIQKTLVISIFVLGLRASTQRDIDLFITLINTGFAHRSLDSKHNCKKATWKLHICNVIIFKKKWETKCVKTQARFTSKRSCSTQYT